MKKLIFILYPIFLILFLFFSYAFVDSNLVFLKNLYTGFSYNNKIFTTIFFTLFVSIFFVFYILFLIFLKKNRLSLKDIKILIAITVCILFLSYPAMLSYDIFNYLTTAKVLFFYQENPYVIMPIEFTGEPYLSFTRASNKIALYGPVWELISGIPYKLGFGNFIITLFSFKLFIVFFYIAMTLLIFRISKSIFSVTLLALNPLVIIETLVNSHNDIVMMFFALLSFWFIKKKRLFFSLFFLLISILIKYATVFLLPVYIYMIWRLYVKKKEINYEKVFQYATFLMLLIFLLSPIREEIYSWYAIWFFTFAALIPAKKFILYSGIIFTFGLLLRYIPYMFTLTYLGYTPLIKTLFSFTPALLFSIYYGLKKKI